MSDRNGTLVPCWLLGLPHSRRASTGRCIDCRWGGSRPWRDRVWFWKPQWHWHGWRTLVPFFRGGDERDWHTICLGWTITGRVIIATRPCPGTGRCDERSLPGTPS